MTLGERIRSLRKARGMTQQELADKLHTTKQTIGKYEQGIVTNLPLSRISELAQALSITPAYLIIKIPHGCNRAERRKGKGARNEEYLAPIIS